MTQATPDKQPEATQEGMHRIASNQSLSLTSPFDDIRDTHETGEEFWSSRRLARLLGYRSYRNFEPVINKAIEACNNSCYNQLDHFVLVHDMVQLGSGSKRKIDSVQLSRYACYLIIQNADPAKEIVAAGQTYFATQTRRQELAEQGEKGVEDQRRLTIRSELREHDFHLADAARHAGVIGPMDYAVFQNHGYMGLYGGLGAREIHARKQVDPGEELLDHMGSAELAANLFRATQTEQKLRRERIIGKDLANATHEEVGQKVRQTIQELGGTMPEELPTVESIKVLEARAQGASLDGPSALSERTGLFGRRLEGGEVRRHHPHLLPQRPVHALGEDMIVELGLGEEGPGLDDLVGQGVRDARQGLQLGLGGTVELDLGGEVGAGPGLVPGHRGDTLRGRRGGEFGGG